MKFFTMLATIGLVLTSAYSNEQSSNKFTTSEQIQWENLRIQELLPGYIVFPSIEPFLPPNFVAQPENPQDPFSPLYWGPEDVVNKFLKNPTGIPDSAILVVMPSLDLAQIDEDSFNQDEKSLRKGLAREVKNYTFQMLKWGEHPVASLRGKWKDREVGMAWVGLNYRGNVLSISLVPSKSGTKKDLEIWSNFLEKTRGLNTYESFKAHRLDLRDGFTLVKGYDTLLKVTAERKKETQKIQVTVSSKDDQVYCKCEKVELDVMNADWRTNDPIVILEAEIHTNGKATIIDNQSIPIFLKDVTEFSTSDVDLKSQNLTKIELGNLSILNFCGKEVLGPMSPNRK